MSLLSKVKDIFKGGSSAKKKKVYHNVQLDNPEDTWRVIGELGDGAYGKVYKAEHRASGKYAALKQVLLEAEDDLDTFMIEIEILCECKHPNVVELLEAYHYDGKLWMYLEYCDGGAVDSIMVDLDRPLNEDQIAILCYHLCQALDYIHTNKVIHRDLKAGNVLLTMEGGVKLADFGVSAKNKNTYDKRGTFIGTPYWLAPEVILCETFIDAKYDYKADIWSLGISLIEFAQMDPPNHEVSPVRVMLKIQKSDPPKLDFPSKWSKEFNDFIAKCLTKDPIQRPDAQELLKHPFLCKPLDKKPVIDLLLEYKAEVVEEDYEDDSEDQDMGRVSSISDPNIDTSKFDSESIISVDNKVSTPVSSVVNDKLPSPTVEDKEVPLSVSDKRLSKGPAPLPPALNTNAQSSPKKGPAPAVPPATSAPAVSTPTISTPSIVTLSPSISNTDKVIVNESRVSNTDVCTPIIATSPESPTLKDASINVSVPNDNEEKIISAPSIDSSSPLVSPSDSVHSDNKNIPEVSDDVSDTKTDNEILIDSIPVGKRVYVYDPEQLDNGTVTVNNTSVSEKVHIEPGTSQTVISSGGVISTSTDIPVSVETHHEEVANISISTSDANVSTLPVMLSVVSTTTTSNASEEMSSLTSPSAPSDVLLASISSEGTVIVRTPTPTPSDSNVTTVTSRRTDNLVTYTVAQNSEINSSEKESLVNQSESQAIFLSEQNITTDINAIDNSLPEAEAQAVLILETAINSAMDSSINQVDSLSESKGEVVIVASEVDDTLSTNDELEKSINDVSGHKLDESEVLISSSSIPEDEEKEPNKAPDHPSPTALESPVASKVNKEDAKDEARHVSVVSVDEETEEVKIVGESSLTSSEVVVDASESTQMSLTIEGTTLEDTDVDEVEDSTSSPSSSINEPLTQVKESVINSNAKEQNKIEHTSFASPSSPSAEEVDSSANLQPKINDQNDKIATNTPLQPIQNGIRRQSSRASDRSDSDTTSIIGSDKENRHQKDESDNSEEVTLRRPGGKASNSSPLLSSSELAAKNLKNKELQASIALRKKTRKRTRKFVIDGVVVTTTTSKVIYGDDEEQGMLSSAHLKRKQELRELKLVQKREQKQFQDLSLKATSARQEQEKKFEIEKINLLRNYDSQIENLTRQQKQLVEKAEARQESELKNESKKIRIDQEREMKAFRESLKQEWKLLKQEVDLLPKDKRKENFKVRKEQLEQDQAKKEKEYLEKLNENHENALKRLNDKHRKHIALKERQFLEEKHQLQRARESALWDMEERHIQDKHQLAKEQLKDIYFLQRLQMTIRHNVELDQVRRFNQQKEDELIKRQHEERRQLPKRIRQEMKTREKMFREQIRISMTQLPSHEQEKEQLKKFQEQEKIKYDKERKRAELKHKKQMEELVAGSESSIKELVHLQNEKGKLLTEHETYKLKNLDEEYQKELKEWKSNLAPRKHKLEEDFERQLREQENFYGDYLDRSLGFCTPAQSMVSLTSTHH